jgi:hypothetical protein
LTRKVALSGPCLSVINAGQTSTINNLPAHITGPCEARRVHLPSASVYPLPRAITGLWYYALLDALAERARLGTSYLQPGRGVRAFVMVAPTTIGLASMTSHSTIKRILLSCQRDPLLLARYVMVLWPARLAGEVPK